MKNLILIRHSKSSWEIPLSDIDRPLSQKGVKDAFLISNKMQNILPKKFIVWCSNAKRTQETCYIFAQNLVFPLESVIFKDSLYTFDYKELYNQIKLCDNRYENIILFGHNDAITKFVNKFGDISIDNVPTTGVVQIEFSSDNWKNIQKGKTKQILFPKLIRENIQNESIH